MTSIRRGLLFVLILTAGMLLTAGCEGGFSQTLPTPIPPEHLPTVIALTVEAGRPTPLPGDPATATPPASAGRLETGAAPAAAIGATATLTEGEESAQPEGRPEASPSAASGSKGGRSLAATVPATPRPTRVRTATPTPTATPYPETTVRIYTPGDASRVVSPLNLTGFLPLLNGGTVRIELFGEDGRTLVRLVKTYQMGLGAWANLKEDLEFQISAVAEVGRLVVRLDDEFGRPVSVNSVDLILLSMGQAELLPAEDLREKIMIERPARLAAVQGGTLLVSGRAREMGEEPLMAELIGEDGRILGQRLIAVTLPGEDGYGTFAGELSYRVDEPTPARLVVYQRGGTISEIAHLSGVGVTLEP